MYRLYDSQNNLVTTQGFPGSQPANFTNHIASCPATASYTYQWSNISSGGVAGLNNPNIQGPLATVAQVTDFQVIATDSLNPSCVAIDTVTCFPNVNTISGTMSGVTNICLGDDVQLDFVLNGSPPFDLTLDITDVNGLSTTQTYQLDANGLISSTGLPLIFTPTVSTTYSVLSLSDITGCPGSISNPALVVTLSDYPSFSVSTINPIICQGQSTILDFNLTGTPNFSVNGTFGSIATNLTLDALGNDASGNPVVISPTTTTTYDFTSITGNNGCATTLNSSITITVNPPIDAGNNAFLPICIGDTSTYELRDIIGPGQDTIGFWTTTSGNQLPVDPNFTFNPQTMVAGNYTYTVVGAPCPNDIATVNISFTNPPFSGFASNQEICVNDYIGGNTFDLNSLLISADAGGVWSYAGSIIPPQINPITYGAGVYQFKYEVFAVGPCNDMNTLATLTINPEPVVGNFSTNIPVVAQGFDVDVLVDMSVGSPPFTVTVVDDETPQNNYTINISPPNMSGLVNVIPNNIPITTYTLIGVTDGKGCSATPNLIDTVEVDPYPFIDPFTTSTPVICEGDNASIYVALSLGEAPIVIDYSYNGNNYVYSLGAVGIANPSATIPIDISGLQIGSNVIKINSLTDNSGVSTPINQLPDSVIITMNANPNVNFSTSTSEICYDDPAILNFNFSAGAPPFSIDYTINSNSQTPLLINGFGNQQYTINPAPNVGSNTYEIINITDANGCIGVPNPNIASIFVNPIPDVNITVSGTNPICQGENSELFFPVLSGTAPYNINYLAGGTSLTTSVDASGNPISGNPMVISPTSSTTYTLVSVTDSKGCFNLLNNDAVLTVNEIPNVIVSGDTEICDQDKTPLFFTFTSGTAPWTVNYNVVSSPGSITLYNVNDTLIVDPNITTKYLFNSISDNNCSATINEDVTITVNSLPQSIITGGGSVCDDGSTIEVQIITTGGSPNYNISYNAGITNKFIADVESPLIINTNESGTYTISEVIDSKGCIAQSINGSVNVYVNEFPEAVLQAYPQPTTLTNPKITFIDASSNHVDGYWDFGDGSIEFTNFDELTHIYQDTGSFEVMLQIESDSGCVSTAYQTIIIDPDFLVYIPEGFTPNNDLKNDYYQPIVSGVLGYEFSIYNRHGQRIFRTNDYSNVYCSNGCSSSWDGLLNNGDYASIGNYTYHIIVFDLNGKERTFQGNISLMR
jgi:gliding motility-associated-like protein